MKNLVGLLFISFFLTFSACQQEELVPFSETGVSGLQTYTSILDPNTPIEPLNGREAMSHTAIDNLIINQANTGKLLNWKEVDDFTLWSAIKRGHSVISIGYKPQNVKTLEELAMANLQSRPWQEVKKKLIDEILSHLNGNTGDNNKIELQNIEVYPVKKRPVLYLRIDDYNLIASLRRNEIVSFIEPAGYSFGSEQVSASKTSIWPGCGDKPVTQFYPGQKLALPTNDYYSWHMGLSNIPEAWEHSMPNNLNQKVTGKGIKVGVIDTGISSDQYYLNAGFQNNVSGRTLSKINNFSIQVGGNEDNCGHGTRMSALVAAPRTNKLTGVAYESSLVMYKAVYNVYIGFGLGEVSAVANALTTAAGDPSVKILSMSIGKVTADTDISIAILQCTLNGKLIFCAAGTNNNSNIAKNIVVFPAILPYTIAVTGLTTASPYEECISCHFGSSVDFSLEIEDQYNSSKAAVTLGRESNSINEYNYSNGASTATATMAGIAALVWSVNPSMTASQVKNILKESSELYGSSKHNKFGWGPVDAAVAVEKAGALPPGYVPPLIASISGPSTFNPASTYNFYSSVPNANAPLIRKWYLNGQFLGTGSFMAIPFIANQTPVSSTITLEVEEVGGDNRTAVATKSVTFLSGSNNSNVESE